MECWLVETDAVELVRRRLVGEVDDVDGESGRHAGVRHVVSEEAAVGLGIFLVQALLLGQIGFRIEPGIGRLRL